MNIDTEKLIEHAFTTALVEGMKDKFRYNSLIEGLLKPIIEKRLPEMSAMLENAVDSCLKDQAFQEAIHSSARSCLAKALIDRFGGEIQKQVNVLKGDPLTRARITQAIEEIAATRKSEQ